MNITAKFTAPDAFLLRRADGCVWFVKLPWPMDLTVPREALRQAVLQYVRSNARMMDWVRSTSKRRIHARHKAERKLLETQLASRAPIRTAEEYGLPHWQEGA